MQSEVEKFCKFPPKRWKTRITIKGTTKRNICVYELRGKKREIEISFNMYIQDFDRFGEVEEIFRDTSGFGVFGKRSSIFLSDKKDIPYALKLIRQSYEKNI